MEIDSNESIKNSPRARLIDPSTTIDKFVNSDVTIGALKSTETDMKFEMLANETKMVDVNDRRYFDKKRDADSYSSSTDSDLDDYINRDKKDDRDTKDHNDDRDKHPSGNSFGNFDYPKKEEHKPHVNLKGGDTADNTENLTKEQVQLKKLDMLRKLGELVQNHKVKLSQNYNMNSDLDMMQKEYELHSSIRSKQNSLNWMASIMMNCIYGVEMANERYNPFDLKLKGWSESVQGQMPSYIDVLGDIYEKYNQPGKKMQPEIKLLLMISAGAIKFHLTKAAMGSILGEGDGENEEEDLENNPELMAKLRSQAESERMTEMNKPENDHIQKKMASEHDKATQMMSDLDMINKHKTQYMEQQQQLNTLNQQLAMMQSNANPLQNLTTEQHELLRQQQIEMHRQQLKQGELKKLQTMQQKVLENEKLLRKRSGSRRGTDTDTMSTMTGDTDNGTMGSKVLLRRRKKKNSNLKVDTN
jgi:hypothetical protein